MNFAQLELSFAKLQFSMKMRAKMYKKIASFSKQGTPVFTTIGMFADAYSVRSGDARAPILKEWLSSMSDGLSFSESVKGFAPDAEVMLIAAGEANGDLEGGMKKAIFVTESVAKIRSTLIGGLSYSAVLIATLMAMIALFSIKVIPQMVDVMPVSKWPALSQQLYFMSKFVQSYGIMVVTIFILFLIISIKTLGVFRLAIRKYFDHLPPWSIYKTIQGSVFLITLSSMMSAGIPLNKALFKIKELSSPYIGDFVSEMINSLAIGLENGEVLDVGLQDYDTALDIKLLGRTSDFQSAMMMIGEESIENTLEKINAITKGIGTAVLFCIAGFVIFVYSGFFSLTQAIAEVAQSTH